MLLSLTLPWFWLRWELLSPAEFPLLGHVHSWLHSAEGSAHPDKGTNTLMCTIQFVCFDKSSNCQVALY